MLGGSPVSNTAISTDEQDGAPIDPRLLGVGLDECERALLDCCPVVLHNATYSKLFALGVHGAGVTGCGLFDALEVADVLFRPASRFDLAREVGAVFGLVSAIIIPVHDETGDIVDLAAWNPDDGALGLWRGAASMLGAENIFAPRLGEPLLVHETPLDWLRAGRQGVFIVDPQRAGPLLRLSEPLGVTREAHGRRLRQALTIPAPRIVVASNARAAA
ncbi:MAG: hypothetical protein ACLPSW_05465 [Roseiarcus sp.]